VKRFEDLIVWQKAQDVYVELKELFGNSKDFFFRDQILRAGLSISNNIAEGFERKSNKEFIYFLFVAKGSCGEVRSMLYLAERTNMSKEELDNIKIHTEEISRMLSGLIKSVRENQDK
jgi:four helix bundle protein